MASSPESAPASLGVDAGLRRLDQRDRWLWIVTLVLVLTQAGAILVLYWPEMIGQWDTGVLAPESKGTLAVGLCGLVVLFCLYILNKQAQMRNLRVRLAAERTRRQALATRLEELTALFEVATRMHPDLPLATFLQALLERLLPGAQADAGAILLVDEDGERVRLAAGAGPHGLGPSGTEWPATEPPFDAIVGSGACLRGATRVCTPAGSNSPVGTLAILAPLSGTRVRGALLLIRADRPFDEQEAALLALFAGHAGHDIERLSRVVALEAETDRLEVSQRQLAERELEEWQFFADLNREIRSALATIAYRVDRCESETSTDSRPELANHIAALAADVRRLSAAVQEGAALLDLEPGPQALQWAPAAMRTVLEDALLRATPLAGSRGVAIEGRLPSDLPAVRTDASRFSRTLSFYLAELLRRTPEGGALRLTARAVLGPEITRRELRCEVRREFDAPWAESARTSHLPLYLLRELIEAGGGAVQEIEEKGARGVRLRLPLAGRAATAAPGANEIGGPVAEAA